ncbi:MAG: Hsp20/alpha crystallin family protein [Oscillospiraceae bacterium]|nr:Hsp20/alpha crystallin family protein [Oscillospiraceae bacterium]
MFDMIPFTTTTTRKQYKTSNRWDPFQEFFGTVVYSAATDIRETDEAFMLETELPGYDKSEISVNMKEGVLTIHAEHKEDDSDNKDYIRRERTWKTVDRSFEVTGVDAAGITAEYVNGILKLTLPKLPEVIPQQHQIEIQ